MLPRRPVPLHITKALPLGATLLPRATGGPLHAAPAPCRRPLAPSRPLSPSPAPAPYLPAPTGRRPFGRQGGGKGRGGGRGETAAEAGGAASAAAAAAVTGPEIAVLWSVVLAAAFVGSSVEGTKIGRSLSGPVVAMLCTAVLGNLGFLPPPGPYLSGPQVLVVKLATPLLMLGADLRKVAAASGRILQGFAAGTVGTAAGAVAASLLFAGPISEMGDVANGDGWKLAAALVAKNVGGGFNYIAVANTLGLSPIATAAGITVDNVFALLYFPAVSWAGDFAGSSKPSHRENAASPQSKSPPPMEGLSEGGRGEGAGGGAAARGAAGRVGGGGAEESGGGGGGGGGAGLNGRVAEEGGHSHGAGRVGGGGAEESGGGGGGGGLNGRVAEEGGHSHGGDLEGGGHSLGGDLEGGGAESDAAAGERGGEGGGHSHGGEGGGHSHGGEGGGAESDAAPGERGGKGAGSNVTSPVAVALCLAVAVAVAGVSEVAFPQAALPTATALTVVLATAFPGRLAAVAPAGEKFGRALLFVYFATAGASSGKVSGIAPFAALFPWCAVVYLVHVTVTLSAGRLLRLPLEDSLVASNANVGGPATAMALASAKGWDRLVVPAVLAGNLGNTIGTFVGLGIGAGALQRIIVAGGG